MNISITIILKIVVLVKAELSLLTNAAVDERAVIGGTNLYTVLGDFFLKILNMIFFKNGQNKLNLLATTHSGAATLVDFRLTRNGPTLITKMSIAYLA